MCVGLLLWSFMFVWAFRCVCACVLRELRLFRGSEWHLTGFWLTRPSALQFPSLSLREDALIFIACLSGQGQSKTPTSVYACLCFLMHVYACLDIGHMCVNLRMCPCWCVTSDTCLCLSACVTLPGWKRWSIRGCCLNWGLCWVTST